MKIKIIAAAVAASLLLSGINVLAEDNMYMKKFDFGDKNTADGFIAVNSKDIYSEKTGWGLKAAYKSGGRDGSEKDDYLTSPDENGIEFTVDVPDGDYTVTVTTGGDTETTANIYINGGERVRVYTTPAGEYQENTQPVVPKDGKIEIQVLGENVKVNSVTVEQLASRKNEGKPTIYVAGDSTAQTYDWKKVYPQTGWAQAAEDYFDEPAKLENRSMGGRSLKSYNNDGRIDKILTELHPGDYVLIQFGHNDGSTKPERYISIDDFKVLLEEKYIKEIEKRGGIPVILTPTPHYSPDGAGKFAPTILDYSAAAMEVGKKCGTITIDAQKAIADRWNELGPETVKNFYFINEPLESKAYPAGTDDHTHFKAAGAAEVAKVIISELKKNINELDKYLQDPYKQVRFSDIEDHWAKSFIEKCSDIGLAEGTETGLFLPEENITRGEFLAMAMRAAGKAPHAFREGECLGVSEDKWYSYWVQGAADKGLIPPDMVQDCVGIEKGEKVLSEATEDKEAVTAEVMIYVPVDLSENSSSSRPVELKFEPEKAITREEMAAIAARIIDTDAAESVNDNDRYSLVFNDYPEISGWASDYVELAYRKGLINGISKETFDPDGTLTRAQAAKVAYKIYETVKGSVKQ